VTQEAKTLWSEFLTLDVAKIAECEFYLIEELDTYLIVHHPYKSLGALGRAMKNSYSHLSMNNEEMQSTWNMINDSYVTDLLLLYAPHSIAAACIYITIVLKSPLVRPSRPPDRIKVRIDSLVQFLGESGIDLEDMAECVQEMISSYVRWETYDEGHCRALVSQHLLGPRHVS
jgi:cyclin C